MNDETAQALAKELLAIQQGSAEDAHALVDFPLSIEEQGIVNFWIDRLVETAEVEEE